MNRHPSPTTRMFARVLLTSLLCSSLAVSACSDEPAPEPVASYDVPLDPDSPWPKFRRNSLQNGRALALPSAASTTAKRWTVQTGKGIFSTPVVGGDGTVYVGSADRYFYAINPDGSIKWKVLTDEIIDSSALLDDKGRVYFGSGDGHVRALNAQTGEEVWRFAADEPRAGVAYINWFEGNIAMLPDGTLLVPNDNYYLYALDRDTGSVRWQYDSGDQIWSLPAVDAVNERLYFANNKVVGIFGESKGNTFALGFDGERLWDDFTAATIAASFLIGAQRDRIFVGGFDGFLRAYDPDGDGDALWEFGARDHIYSSPAEMTDGTLIQGAADGTVYAINPADGSTVWAFDTVEPVRSSPAIDGAGNVYFGNGEGKLFVLNPDGSLRWSLQLVHDPRNDLNSSPAIGHDAVYIASESGEIFGVPLDYCLHAGTTDPDCSTAATEALPDDLQALVYTTNFGALAPVAPAAIQPNASLTFTLVHRAGGDTLLAFLDDASLAVTSDPYVPVDAVVSGDRKFVTITPRERFVGDSSNQVTLQIQGDFLDNAQRKGLKFTGGSKAGSYDSSFTFDLDLQTSPADLQVPGTTDKQTVWEALRLAAPLPTILPSYNQIGFDSLHFVIGIVDGDGTTGVAWFLGGILAEGENKTIIDPATKAMMPLSYTYKDGALTLEAAQGLKLEVMTAELAFSTFRMDAALDENLAGLQPATLHATVICEDLGFFADFVRELGFCHPDPAIDLLSAYGAINLAPFDGGSMKRPADVGTIAIEKTAAKITASFDGSALQADDHAMSILLVDNATGAPLALDYGLESYKTAHGDGSLKSISISTGGVTLPASTKAYVLVDTYPVAVTDL